MKRLFSVVAAVGVLTSSFVPAAWAEPPLKVVATFSIVADLTKKIGGDAISLTTLAGPGADAHTFEPSAEAQRAVAGARLVVANGLGFEPWLDRLLGAAGFTGDLVIATKGIEPLAWTAEGAHDDEEGAAEGAESGHDHDHEAVDPHAFQDPKLVLTYIDNIEAGLAAADPGHANDFAVNADALKAEFKKLDAELLASLGAIPPQDRRILTSHDAFQYFGHAYGLTFIGVQGGSTDSEPSAQDLKNIVRQIEEGGIRALFLENMTDPRFIKTVAEDTGANLGGELYSDSLSDADGPAQDLVSLFRHNQAELMKALQ